jgi:hypothetical protein
MRKESISHSDLLTAVKRAEDGLVDADLGGGIIKQRIPRNNEGRSGGFRSILVFRSGERAFFIHGFAKNDRENISKSELKALKLLAQELLSLTEAQLESATQQGKLLEINQDE